MDAYNMSGMFNKAKIQTTEGCSDIQIKRQQCSWYGITGYGMDGFSRILACTSLAYIMACGLAA
jgi:hypothetical protein